MFNAWTAGIPMGFQMDSRWIPASTKELRNSPQHFTAQLESKQTWRRGACGSRWEGTQTSRSLITLNVKCGSTQGKVHLCGSRWEGTQTSRSLITLDVRCGSTQGKVHLCGSRSEGTQTSRSLIILDIRCGSTQGKVGHPSVLSKLCAQIDFEQIPHLSFYEFLDPSLE